MGVGIGVEKKLEGVGRGDKVKLGVCGWGRKCGECGIKEVGIVGIEGGLEL